MSRFFRKRMLSDMRAGAAALPTKQRRNRASHRAGRRLIHEPLEPRHLLNAGPLLITEFMAANKGVLADEDGAYSDWIEIHNPTDAPVDLDGWYLTDDSDELMKWEFPPMSIDAGAYLTVFASNNDRINPAGTLHTNFKLTADGEYLALVRPDGLAISHEYTTFPPLADNVSFGLPGRADDLSYHVPTSSDAGLGAGWTAVGYDDSAWSGASSSSVHITEIGTGTPDYIEIQNLAGTVVDTSGWTLAMKQSYATPINDPGIVEVALPSVMYPGQIFFRTNLANNWRFDLLHQDTKFPTSVTWYPTQPGWASVLDDQGVVVDFVAWGYTEAELATLDVTINGFQVTADTAWLGAPVPATTTSTPILSRVGASDHDNAGDFAWDAPTYSWWSSSSVTTGSIGAPNPGLASTFATTDPTIGYAAYSVGLDTRIPTDVSWAMRGVNSSIWTRREFESDGPTGLTELTLRIRYNDGFVAYLNGVEIARNNAPATVLWDSAATASRGLAESIQYVDIDVSAHLGLLQPGVNVLAVQGLNNSAADADFLLEAELIGAGSADAHRYFFTPTPGAPNGTGASPTDMLPEFSQPTGVYYAPFDLTLTTTVPGGVIRYTLDQTDPTETSPAYTGPITISESERVRAAVFLQGQSTSLVASESYFVLDPALQSFDTNLGMIVIDTFGQSINQTDYATVSTAFFDTGDDDRASLADTPEYTSLAGLKLRGTYSLWLNDTFTGLPGDVRMGEKPSYRLELRDELGDDQKASILGLPRESDWVLYSLYDDKTLMRDYLSYQWFNETGNWAPAGRYIELYVNEDGDEVTDDDYVGLYILFQKIEIGEDLVDINEMAPEDSTAPDVTGGYLIQKDRVEPGDTVLTTSRGYRFIYSDPDTKDISEAQQAYFLGYMNEFESVLYGTDFADPYNGYAKYIDVDSFIDMHIMQEVAKNWDGYRTSCYFYKDRDGKLASGPLWDMNITFGASHYSWGTDWTNPSPELWHYSLISSSDYASHYYLRLFQDPEFKQKYIDRFDELLSTVFSEEKMMQDMTAVATYLDEAQQRHFDRWDNLMGEYIWPAAWWGQTYEEEVDLMRNWIHARLMWIKSQFTTAPEFSEDESEPAIRLSAPTGTIYYTTDGTDPRLTGGGISPNAIALDTVAADTPFIASGATWMYSDTGVDLGTAWRDLSFDRTAWSSGPSQLGYGDGDEATVVDYGTNAAEKYTTTYFAKTFEVADASAFESVQLRLLRDDAAVVYVNGQEVVRSNITYANVYYDTLATQDVSSTQESQFFEYDLDPSILVDGTNIVTVEVHQSYPGSSDLSFDLELKGIGGVSGELAADQNTRIIGRTLSNGNWSGMTEAVTTVAVPPTVEYVLVRGSAWTETLLDDLDAQGLGHPSIARLGYRVPAGAGQFDTLPWGNLDTITMVFSEDVVVTQADLTLLGVNVAEYPVAGFAYDSGTSTATWTLASPIHIDRLLVQLDAAVQDRAGNALDGEWQNGTSEFPTGDGAAGGEFRFALNVLPADANRDGLVTDLDVSLLATHWQQVSGAMPADGDFTGDGKVDDLDVSILAGNWRKTLPLHGDANTDDTVTDLDISLLAAHWQQQSDATWADGDFNGDGKVDDLDVSLLAGNWQLGVEQATSEAARAAVLPTVLEASPLVEMLTASAEAPASLEPVRRGGRMEAASLFAKRLVNDAHDAALAEEFGEAELLQYRLAWSLEFARAYGPQRPSPRPGLARPAVDVVLATDRV